MRATSGLKVVIGAGPVGAAVAEQFAAAGHAVRVLTRSGSGPEDPQIERRVVDAHDEPALTVALDGADAVFHCIHAPYEAKVWARELPAAEHVVMRAAGERVVVFPESLYSYSDPSNVMTEDSPRAAASGKRGVRTQVLAARTASSTPTVSVVASDFFGPHVRTAYAGERMVMPIINGKRVRVLGSADQPHSFTYVPDLARAMIAAAGTPALWNSVLHAPTGPASTQRTMAGAFATAAGTTAKVSVVPGWVVRGMGVASTQMRELAEMLYQLESPFVMDSARSQALLGLAPTPLDQAARETVAWWRANAVIA